VFYLFIIIRDEDVARFLADENIEPSTVELLRQLGHDVLDVKEDGWYGLTDEEVFDLAKRTDGILLSLNWRDFGDQERFPAAETAGIIVIRVRPSVAAEVNPRLRALIISTRPEVFRGKLTVVYRRGWRIGARGRATQRRP